MKKLILLACICTISLNGAERGPITDTVLPDEWDPFSKIIIQPISSQEKIAQLEQTWAQKNNKKHKESARPLFLAVMYHDLEVVKFLLRKQFDTSYTTNGNNLLHLLFCGPNLTIDKVTDKFKNDAREKLLPIGKALVTYGVELHTPNTAGKTAHHFATLLGLKELLTL